jgi:hypothetical protein
VVDEFDALLGGRRKLEAAVQILSLSSFTAWKSNIATSCGAAMVILATGNTV